MALRTLPAPIARPEPNLTLLRGRGMTPAALREEAAIEEQVRDTEVAEFVTAARPHARRLEFASREIGPTAHHHALTLLALIDRLERRWGEAA